MLTKLDDVWETNTFIFDLKTKERIDKNLITDKDNLPIGYVDYSKAYREEKKLIADVLQKNDFENIKTEYDLHNIEYDAHSEYVKGLNFDMKLKLTAYLIWSATHLDISS